MILSLPINQSSILNTDLMYYVERFLTNMYIMINYMDINFSL